MTTDTHTKAGLLASAGAARLGAVSHLSSTWTQGAIAKPATFMVPNCKHRPTRPLSEHSP